MSFPLQYEQAQDRDEESAWDSTVEDESPRKVENKVSNEKVVSRKKDEVRLCAIAESHLPHFHWFIIAPFNRSFPYVMQQLLFCFRFLYSAEHVLVFVNVRFYFVQTYLCFSCYFLKIISNHCSNNL